MSDCAFRCPRHPCCCFYILAAVQLVIGLTVRDSCSAPGAAILLRRPGITYAISLFMSLRFFSFPPPSLVHQGFCSLLCVQHDDPRQAHFSAKNHQPWMVACTGNETAADGFASCTHIFLYFPSTSEYLAFCYIHLTSLAKSLNKHSHLLPFHYLCSVICTQVSADIGLFEQTTVSGKHIAV